MIHNVLGRLQPATDVLLDHIDLDLVRIVSGQLTRDPSNLTTSAQVHGAGMDDSLFQSLGDLIHVDDRGL